MLKNYGGNSKIHIGPRNGQFIYKICKGKKIKVYLKDIQSKDKNSTK